MGSLTMLTKHLNQCRRLFEERCGFLPDENEAIGGNVHVQATALTEWI